MVLGKTCRACEEDGMIVKEFVVIGSTIRCQRCSEVVGEISFHSEKISDEPENYQR